MNETIKDEEQLHDEAEQLRGETASDAPELQEHDHVAALEKELEEARSRWSLIASMSRANPAAA